MGFHFNNPVFIALILVSLSCLAKLSHGQGTKVGFYDGKCNDVEPIVRSAIERHFKTDPAVAPKLLRMFFHDCFINGCDGSVLLNHTNAERFGVPNLSLRGFDAIEEAKQMLEQKCPGVVSCADILALAARDSVVLTRGFTWHVKTGRRDGLISRASDTLTLPGFRDTVDVQLQKFTGKGLNIQDLVTLVGAHTIGTAGCGTFSYRLYNYSNTNKPDPTIAPDFLPVLQKLCPQGGDSTVRVDLDTGNAAVFENQYFNKLRDFKGVLESDQRLRGQASSNAVVKKYIGFRGLFGLTFQVEFPKSMNRMGDIGVKTGAAGEIRKVCYATN